MESAAFCVMRWTIKERLRAFLRRAPRRCEENRGTIQTWFKGNRRISG